MALSDDTHEGVIQKGHLHDVTGAHFSYKGNKSGGPGRSGPGQFCIHKSLN